MVWSKGARLWEIPMISYIRSYATTVFDRVKAVIKMRLARYFCAIMDHPLQPDHRPPVKKPFRAF